MIRQLRQPWIFLRGLSREKAHWGSFPNSFQEAIPDADIGFLDLPGSGLRYDSICPSNLPEIAESVRNDWFSSHPHEPAFALGMSLGGMTILEWASRYPSEFRGIVLINCSLGQLSPFYERLRPRNWFSIFRAMFAQSEFKRQELIFKMTSSLNSNPHVISEWVEIQKQHPVKFRNFVTQILSASRFKLSKPISTVPVLVLNSQRDYFVNPRCSERLSDFLKAPLRTHPTAGHDLTLDAKEWVTKQVEDWLHRLVPQKGLGEALR